MLKVKQQLLGGHVCEQGQLQTEKEASYTGCGLPIQSGKAQGTYCARCRQRHRGVGLPAMQGAG